LCLDAYRIKGLNRIFPDFPNPIGITGGTTWLENNALRALEEKNARLLGPFEGAENTILNYDGLKDAFIGKLDGAYQGRVRVRVERAVNCEPHKCEIWHIQVEGDTAVLAEVRLDEENKVVSFIAYLNLGELGTYTVTPRRMNQAQFIAMRFLSDLLYQARRIFPSELKVEPIVLRQDWLRAYDFATDRGAAALNAYARTNDPFAKLGSAQVSVEISSVIRASPESFRVAWTERRYDSGQLAATERWTAILSVIIETPRDADRLRKNPLGVYVNSINWSKELG
jgi:hypothetical protein